jgi:hypothetical protein
MNQHGNARAVLFKKRSKGIPIALADSLDQPEAGSRRGFHAAPRLI